MKELFISFLNVGINGSILIAAVVLTRFLFKNHNRGIICFLWGLVALRMLIPVNIPMDFSLLPTAQSVSAENVVAEVPATEAELHRAPATDTAVNSGSNVSVPVTDGMNNGEVQPPQAVTPNEDSADRSHAYSEVTSDEKTAADETPMDAKDIFIRYGTVVWLVGMACMVIYFVICDILLRFKTRVRYEKEKGVYLCDDVKSPFVMGVIRPRIMLPSSTDEENEHFILMHEKAHIERGDHIWKVLAFAVLALHWYNPLVWLSFILYSRDTEFACDERVIRKNGTEIRKAYAHALLTYSMGKGGSVHGGWSFSQRSLAVRIKSVLNYKKPALWVFISFGLACTVLVVCFMTVPVEGDESESDDTPVSATEGTEETETPESTEPTEPEPTELEPTEPEPTEPEPTEPEPTEPEPTEPEPTEPEPLGPAAEQYNIIARDVVIDGEEVVPSCRCPFTVSKIKNLSELEYWFTVPIINGTEFTNECQIAVKAIDSYQELYDSISVYNFKDNEYENKRIIKEYISVYLNHEGFPNHEVVDEMFFEDNIVMIILGDASLESITKSGNELSLMFNTTVRHSDDPMPPTVVPHTGESYIFEVYGITRADMLDVDTISISVRARNPK